jgi:outer membrane protein OmpA-like peptidoglycan-associated protein
MRYRIVLGAVALAAFLPALAPAQEQPAPAPTAGPHREHSWELSVGGGAAYLDDALTQRIQTSPVMSRVVPGGVVRLGYNLSRSWGLSVGTGVGYSKPATVIQPFAALTWTPNINSSTNPFLTAGAGASYSRWADTFCAGGNCRITGIGGHLGLGIRQMLGASLALRVEVREQYEHYSPTSLPGAVFHSIGTVGFSWFIGGGRAGDADGDGVPDQADRCSNTPRGAIVDARGCPADSDRDGVPDGLDRCANTPAGSAVDARGCTADSDGDGVPDALDKCVNTPAGMPVYPDGPKAGCPVDSDGDGVPDTLDRCANTPAGVQVYTYGTEAGCAVDTDGDGVADYQDRCPGTPHGVAVGPTGCPVDSDHDGVPDTADRCPGTPAGTQVDAAGCPVAGGRPQARADTSRAAPPAAVNATIVLHNVVFRPNSARLPPEGLGELNMLAASMRSMPNARWEISGHTSRMGNAATNRRLSQLRAFAVRRYLVRRGVPAASLVSVGYGSEHPVATNATVAGRRENMRVEVKRLR